MSLHKSIFTLLKAIAKKIPAIRIIPAFDSIPTAINSDNLRFYKLSNLVLTLGMFVHLHWIFYFFFLRAYPMSAVNIFSVLTYITSIVLNRRGHHFTSSIIMVLEIIIHQVFAVFYFGASCGFQYYILVISIFPFLMPRGKWLTKVLISLNCIISFVFLNFFWSKFFTPMYQIGSIHADYLNLSNTLFSFFSLTLSGAFYSLAMHDTEDVIKMEKQKSDNLLLNILPANIAQELKQIGKTEAQLHDNVTIMFTDFKDFTKLSEELTPSELVKLIDYYFKSFDRITTKYKIEKIKTIGDAFMCVAGFQAESKLAAKEMILCALEILDFITNENKSPKNETKRSFDIRIGINTGSVVAGVVGETKFAYDIWGDAVNIASRMEKLGEINSINISDATYQIVKDDFDFIARGEIEVKNKGYMKMYQLNKT